MAKRRSLPTIIGVLPVFGIAFVGIVLGQNDVPTLRDIPSNVSSELARLIKQTSGRDVNERMEAA